MRFLSFFLLLFAAPAHAENVVLMVNMNYSAEELKAAEEVAAARGQRVVMVPPKDMVTIAEPMFRLRDEIKNELKKKLPNLTRGDITYYIDGFMREGTKWDPDSEAARLIGQERIRELAARTKKVFDRETLNGSMLEQLERKAAALKANGDRVDSTIFSSHSDGSNLTGETTLRLSANDLVKLQRDQPEIFEVRHAMMMGCYNLTKPNHQAWRYDLFPHATMLAGFGLRAPSRFDPKSANFIREMMAKGNELDRKMLAAGRPLDKEMVAEAFKELSTFTTEAHPGVVDYCYQIVEGRPGAWSHNCDKQWEELYDKKQNMEKYWSLTEPEEASTDEALGELRNYYNTLQMACDASEVRDASIIDFSPEDAEAMRVKMRERMIRTIYWGNVQSNFSTYFAENIRRVENLIAAAGISVPMPKLNGTVSRGEFVETFNFIFERLNERPSSQNAFMELYGPLFFLNGESSVGAGESLSVEATLARGAIPFNWIEGSTVRKDE